MGSIASLILNGGASSRFGSPKWKFLIDGHTLLQRALSRSVSITNEVFVSVNSIQQKKRILENESDIDFDFVIDDSSLPHLSGPLLGLISAIEIIKTDILLVQSIDYPYLTAELLLKLVQLLETHPIEIASFIIERNVASTILAINMEQVKAKMDALRCLPDSRLSGFYRSCRSIGLFSIKFATQQFLNLNTPSDLDTIFSSKELQYDPAIIINPKRNYETFLKLSNQPVKVDKSVIIKELQSEQVQWEGIDWVTNHIQKDKEKLQ